MAPVRTVPLGATGIEVSNVFFGAGTILGVGSFPHLLGKGITAAEALSRLDEAAARHISVVDTANAYAGGGSERVVGAWLPGHDDVLVCSKVGRPVLVDGIRQGGLSPAHIARQFEASTARLGRVDLYLTHFPDPETPIAATIDALASLIADGRIRAYGCCNVTSTELEAILDTADRRGLPRPGWVQNPFNLIDRSAEEHLIPLLRAEGLGFTPFAPLVGGVLSDRYLEGRKPEPGSRMDLMAEEYAYALNPATLARVAELSRRAKSLGVSTAGLALAWLMHRDGVTAPIVAPRTTQQWKAVDEALTFVLDRRLADEIADIFG
ncbi:aldo/keto reductase [Catenuloplanes atrovinosus]|uniref:Aryl-alcohol dehydrogenase-like predicted oxidoreductase n=1 Tax=Catenuloplanes atrovinosus TaxID=137266 RepID=A0AAE3YQC2_9ACTN|nr:aldo/keto reductase [Catenuloplanes atrovinosus]MDR7277327.1 aryl-alcohol dehydrogenase-like predicted oxidoreductase [Catenuloplanes atrovinosus]